MVRVDVLELSLQLLVKQSLTELLLGGGALLRELLQLTQVDSTSVLLSNFDHLLEEVLVYGVVLGRLGASQEYLEAEGDVLLLVFSFGGAASLVYVKGLEDFGELEEEKGAVGFETTLVLRLLASWADYLTLGQKLVKEVSREVCSLDQELAYKPDKSELDVCEVTCLVEPLDDPEHVYKVEPVSLLRPVLLWAQRLLKHKLTDEVNRVVLRVQHRHMQHFQHLVDENRKHAFVLQSESSCTWVDLIHSVVVKSVLNQEKH